MLQAAKRDVISLPLFSLTNRPPKDTTYTVCRGRRFRTSPLLAGTSAPLYINTSFQGYTQHTVNRTIEFFDQRTGADTNTIESTWRHVKAYLSPYNRKVDYIYHLAHYTE